jgi:flagella basal body P-ring formation protein FlgA
MTVSTLPRSVNGQKNAHHTHGKVEVQARPRKGRVVVARQRINAGEVIDSSPAVSVTPQERGHIDKTKLFQYYFVRPDEYHSDKNGPGYLVFGLASFCSHASHPNAQVQWVQDDIGLWAHLVAKQDIAKGEEITLYYTNVEQYEDHSKFH